MANDTVAIANANKTENVAVNGGLTIGEGLSKFFGCGVAAVEGKLAGMTVRLNNGTVEVPGDLRQPLRGGDFISMYTNEIARGGIKGAV